MLEMVFLLVSSYFSVRYFRPLSNTLNEIKDSIDNSEFSKFHDAHSYGSLQRYSFTLNSIVVALYILDYLENKNFTKVSKTHLIYLVVIL